ncbi:MAG: DNA-directed RNA polymerase subunit omega [Firmicutes bacterium HGW-Firmicutes-12]|jgi:DNA-directed RNA polymerase subunit omega|nr:MAG: DNA-directed RNA polymerase subunit omega [Firmicutes bacterium HGW-Firmicutes-12]
MRQPAIDSLIQRTESKYALVVAAAKRARLITEGTTLLTEKSNAKIIKPVTQALEEIASGKLLFESPNSGIK